jgi:hypothetical protein
MEEIRSKSNVISIHGLQVGIRIVCFSYDFSRLFIAQSLATVVHAIHVRHDLRRKRHMVKTSTK